jgi:type I restriction enzyme S subunit
MKTFWIDASEDRLTPEGVAAATWLAPPRSTLLLVRGMTLHNDIPIARIRRESAFNQDVKAVVSVGPAIPEFIPYLLLGYKTDLLNRVDSAGHGTGRLSMEVLSTLPVWLPGKVEQEAIVALLGALDDKIELNRRMAETLEATARALFRSWFVDFDPVRAKAEGRPTGLPDNLAALFPDCFNDDGVPTGWHFGTVDEIADLNPESWSRNNRPKLVESIDLSNTKSGIIEQIQTFTTEDAPSRAQRVLRPRDTIIGTVRPGNNSYAYILREGLTGSTGFAVLRPRQAADAGLVYLCATAISNIDALAQLADGAAYPAVRPEIVAQTPISLPDNSQILNVFSTFVDLLLSRRHLAPLNNQTLAALRDTLLPKLISGELRIADAERLVAAAG